MPTLNPDVVLNRVTELLADPATPDACRLVLYDAARIINELHHQHRGPAGLSRAVFTPGYEAIRESPVYDSAFEDGAQ